MINIKGVGEFFSLDIGANAIRAVQLSKTGENSWNLTGLGYVSVDPQLVLSESEESRRKLGEVITTMIGQSDIKAKNVAISLSSQKTYTTVIDVAARDEKELKQTMEYQLDQYIPMAIDDAKVDWVMIGPSADKPETQEVLVASTSKAYSEDRLEFIENLGFNVVAAEPDSISMARSLAIDSTAAQLIVDFGENSTDIALYYGNAPRLVRSIPIGIGTLVKSAVQNLNIKEDQARQFILKFGLAQDKLDAQVFRAIEANLENFAQELIKSIKFFSTKYPQVPVGTITLSGYAGIIPQLSEYVSSKTGIQAGPVNPFQRVNVPNKYQQTIANIGNEFAVAVGLAERIEK
ncbi:MAG: type IV pilus assembly protein PilM [bacterium]|nr:type IV pilus assembly protein PilM [bacterium]